ncbi:GntR family transcriptional regulator [Marinicrinis sediminis]|uniref:GntR family transcriptional regulator n=1 Tax=Marinicrinis sediminis TaxID=1652465 RepID=A0ABW5R7R0_9BACL
MKSVKTSTRDTVYNILKEKIIDLSLAPGMTISENEMAESLKVSRTPIREALIRLSQEELVEIYPQKGTTISRIDLSLVEEARFMREQLERAVIREAAERIPEAILHEIHSNLAMQEIYAKTKDMKKLYELDGEFHEWIFIGCGKHRIWKLIYSMDAHLNRLRMLQYTTSLDWVQVVGEHQQIARAIELHDMELAEQLVQKHLNTVQIDQEKLKEAYPTYFSPSV